MYREGVGPLRRCTNGLASMSPRRMASAMNVLQFPLCVLIVASGVLSSILGLKIGALIQAPDPGGRFGHVGAISGLIAIAIGASIVWLVWVRYPFESRKHRIVTAILLIVLGHAGAVAGALIVGTAGAILCYALGIWLLLRRGE